MRAFIKGRENKGGVCIKTIIELFDECQIENAIAGLRFKPEKIIFIGDDSTMTEDKTTVLREFFSKRNPGSVTEFQYIDSSNYRDIKDKLHSIIDNNEDCCFDLTGGAELVIAAMSVVSVLRNIPMVKINVRNGKITAINSSEAFDSFERSVLTIREIVQLNGCYVIPDACDNEFVFNERFKKDIESIWNASKRHPTEWNKQISALKSFQKQGYMDENYRVKASFSSFNGRDRNSLIFPEILDRLEHAHVLCDINITNNGITFRYKDEQVYNCLTKAGNILEIYTYMLLQEIEQEHPGYYDDIDRGVNIDWDGVIYKPGLGVSDTKNEIDVMVMRDLVPVFISCKNGDVGKPALYELDAVSRRIGGKYAKRVLVATHVSHDISTYRHIKQRAKDMKIVDIFDVDKMTRDEFKQELKTKII